MAQRHSAIMQAIYEHRWGAHVNTHMYWYFIFYVSIIQSKMHDYNATTKKTYLTTHEAVNLQGSELRIKLSLATLSVRYRGASNGSRTHFSISATA